MIASKEGVAGFGHTSSLWFHFVGDAMAGYTIESPKSCESLPPDSWFEQQMLILHMTPKHLQKSWDVLPYLTICAGDRAVKAMRDYHVYELALAFTSHYCWQLVNGAKILPAYSELAKVYAGCYAIYLFRSVAERSAALQAASLKT